MIAALLFSLPLLIALTAWATAYGILSLLLYPLVPRRVIGIRVQGYLPSCISSSADDIATIMAEAIVAAAHKRDFSADGVSIAALRPVVEAHLDTYLRIRLKEKLPVIASFIGENTIVKLRESMIEEVDELLPQVINQYISSSLTVDKVQPHIKNFLASLDPIAVETVVLPFLRSAKMRVPAVCGLIGLLAGTLLSAVLYAVNLFY